MFDIGFWELVVIAVVALVVVGPERLPGLARTAGRWVGRTRRFISTVKADIEREMRAEELQQILKKQNDLRDVYEIVEETRSEVKQAVTPEANDVPTSPVTPVDPGKKEPVEQTAADGEKGPGH